MDENLLLGKPGQQLLNYLLVFWISKLEKNEIKNQCKTAQTTWLEGKIVKSESVNQLHWSQLNDKHRYKRDSLLSTMAVE